MYVYADDDSTSTNSFDVTETHALIEPIPQRNAYQLPSAEVEAGKITLTTLVKKLNRSSTNCIARIMGK